MFVTTHSTAVKSDRIMGYVFTYVTLTYIFVFFFLNWWAKSFPFIQILGKIELGLTWKERKRKRNLIKYKLRIMLL